MYSRRAIAMEPTLLPFPYRVTLTNRRRALNWPHEILINVTEKIVLTPTQILFQARGPGHYTPDVKFWTFTALLCAYPRSLTNDDFYELIWGENEPEHIEATFRMTCFALNRRIAQDKLVIVSSFRGRCLQVLPGAKQLEAGRFIKKERQCRRS